MKERVEGVLACPYLDKLVIRIIRHLDRWHVPTERVYTSHYSNPDKCRRMVKRFLLMNQLVQERILEERIARWANDKS